MDEDKSICDPTKTQSELESHLSLLNLSFMKNNFESLNDQAIKKGWSHINYLASLAEGEASLRRDRSVERRIRLARFPVKKTLEQFRWTWPTAINRAAVQNLFRLKFIQDNCNVIFLGGVGLGKTHLATALGYAACIQGKSVLFTSAIDVINTLSVAHSNNRLKPELKKWYVLNDPVNAVDPLGLAKCQYSISAHTLVCWPNDPGFIGPPISLGPDGVFSGMGECRNSPPCSDDKNKGPIPPGNYNMNPDNRPGHERFWRLEPNPKIPGWKYYLGMARSGFELHPGSVSLGCITTDKNNPFAMDQYGQVHNLLQSESGSNALDVVP